MTQSAPQVGNTGRAAQPSPDIDELLSALNAEAQRALNSEQTPAALSSAGGQGAASLPERQAGDATGRRVQALVRAFDVLHKQVGAIASQGETINSIANTQARQDQALAELQRTMRYLRAIVIQQLQGATPRESALPPPQVKLVLAHLAESHQQAQHDAGVLGQWAMLFAGLCLGAALGTAMGAYSGLMPMLLMLGTAGVLALLVALIFGVLARQARHRAQQARRAMDESSMLHVSGGMNGKDEG